MLKRLIRAVGARHAAADTRFVAFVAPAKRVRAVGPGEVIYSPLASLRLRALIPAARLARQVRTLIVPLDWLLDPANHLRDLGDPAAVVLTKLSTRFLRQNPALVDELGDWVARDHGATRVVADLCDDYAAWAEALDAPHLARHQQALLEHCRITVPCASLAERVSPVVRRELRVIEDPYEAPEPQPPHVGHEGSLRASWFGHLGGPIDAVVENALARVAAAHRETAMAFTLVGPEEGAGWSRAVGARLAGIHPGAQVRFLNWSLEAVAATLAASDLVLLPQDHASQWGAVKSHNRLVETLRAGRFAVGSPIPSYVELAAYAWVGEDLAEGVAWLIAHRDEAVQRIAAGQAHIAARFSPEAVTRKWAAELGIEAA